MKAGFCGEWHRHPLAQLIYPSRGVMTLRTRGGSWVTPPLRGCWLPPAADHQVRTATGLDMHSVYFEAPPASLPADFAILSVSPLARELILELAKNDLEGERRQQMGAVLLGQLRPQFQLPLFLPDVSDPKLAVIAGALRTDPADPRTLEAWSDILGTTSRTLARRFARETGLSFVEFRRQLRLHAALERLGAGRSVTIIAHETGFSSAANFIATFRRAMGETPRRYFRDAAARW